MNKKIIFIVCLFLNTFVLFGCSEQPKVENTIKTKETLAVNKQGVKEEPKQDLKQESKESTNTKEPFKSGKEDLDLIVEKSEIKQVDGGYDIVCEIKSNRDYDLIDVVAEIMYYDKDVKVLGTSTEKTDVVKAKGTWKFTAHMPSAYVKDFKAYRVSKLTGHK